jgi:transposase, IS5 family
LSKIFTSTKGGDMAQKTSGQCDFTDAWLGHNPLLNQRLDKIDQLVDWRPFTEKLNRIYASPTGRPSHPVLLLFKSLLLQAWYSLSDYALEETLDDRLSFRRFAGLSVSAKAPDHSVFSRFRDQLIKHGMHEKLFIELDRQLEQRGLLIKKGTLVDATVIEAAPKKPNQNEDGSGGKSDIDPEADWTKKGGKYLFGYKAHVGVDQGSELIRRIVLTPAHVHDGEMLRQVVTGDEDWAFADKAYDSTKNHQILHEKNIENGILMKGTLKRKLSRAEKLCNRILSKLRCPVERVFGTLKRTYRYSRARYLGLRKNCLQMMITSMAYNLRRMEKLCT